MPADQKKGFLKCLQLLYKLCYKFVNDISFLFEDIRKKF